MADEALGIDGLDVSDSEDEALTSAFGGREMKGDGRGYVGDGRV